MGRKTGLTGGCGPGRVRLRRPRRPWGWPGGVEGHIGENDMTEDDRRMTERTTIPTYSRSDPPDPVEPYKPNTIRAVEAPDGRRAL